MGESFCFSVPGSVVAWKRAQSSGKKRFTPKPQREYQSKVREHAMAMRPALWPMNSRYSVVINYVPTDRRRRDVDNVVKTLMDALNGVAWDDDSQVDTLFIRRHARDGNKPGVYVKVERLVNHA